MRLVRERVSLKMYANGSCSSRRYTSVSVSGMLNALVTDVEMNSLLRAT